MSGWLPDQARHLDRAERRWLADARDRLRRTRAAATVPTTLERKADR